MPPLAFLPLPLAVGVASMGVASVSFVAFGVASMRVTSVGVASMGVASMGVTSVGVVSLVAFEVRVGVFSLPLRMEHQSQK